MMEFLPVRRREKGNGANLYWVMLLMHYNLEVSRHFCCKELCLKTWYSSNFLETFSLKIYIRKYLRQFS